MVYGDYYMATQYDLHVKKNGAYHFKVNQPLPKMANNFTVLCQYQNYRRIPSSLSSDSSSQELVEKVHYFLPKCE